MATETSTTQGLWRALCAPLACAFLALGGASGGFASPVHGPVANFGPALVADAPAGPPAEAAQERRPVEPGSPESRPLMFGKKATPAIVDGAAARRESGDSSWLRVFGALAAVLALIFVLKGAVKRVAARGGLRGQLGAGGRAPSGVLEVLGRYPVSRGQTLVLLRLDQRVLLLGQSSAGFRTLADFDDPSEVASLLMRTRDEESESISGRFKHLMTRFERDPSMGEGVEHIDLTRRTPLIQRAAASVAPASSGGVRRVPTSRESHDAIRRRLESMKGVAL